ncbi:hypothetical protein F5B20DRAFT_596494 [Whalleya microplaca]|nr:hypothetical protein F5B20DRAFT_596494 [Whalleya microplaca]
MDSLPTELLCLVLQELKDFQDLSSVIKASPSCFRAFAGSRRIILSSIFKNMILPGALHHALALVHIPSPPDGEKFPYFRDLDCFLHRYFQEGSLEFPTELSMVTCISFSRLAGQISRSVDAYFDDAMESLGIANQSSPQGCMPLSSIERTRLQRAFLRFELYCRVYPEDFSTRCSSHAPGLTQWSKFVKRMEPWEPSENCEMGHADDSGERMCYLENLNPVDLGLFSESRKSDANGFISYMASLGLGFMDKLITADDHERKDLIRRHAPRARHFLPEALGYSAGGRPAAATPAGGFTDDINRPKLGWFRYKCSDWDRHLPAKTDGRFSGITRFPIRTMGCVFWDAGRICCPAVDEAFREANGMDMQEVRELYSREYRPTPEERLKGVQIPESQLGRIIREYGSINDMIDDH